MKQWMFACLSSLMLWTAAEGAETLIGQHVGANNPTNENWTFSPVGTFGPRYDGVPLTPDPVGGIDAWAIDGTGVNTNLRSFYYLDRTIGQAGTADQRADAWQTNGWRLQVRMRIVSASTTPNNNIFIGIAGTPAETGTGSGRRFDFHFGDTVGGDPILRFVQTGTDYTLTGLGSGYHVYDFFYFPSSNSLSVFADNTLVVSGLNPSSDQQLAVAWGDRGGTAGEAGHANWNLVSWYVVPEPTALGLIGLAGLAFLRFRRGS